ncbi:hypothetical protein E2C01_027195 [Portunus trituberculatus]|uniref:Secreted protein n=1 Tax=Portunus trituberculatus TaxID=210409 RepID=A0A5B7EL03_PORTR|nr:hypothetical protein [Portunus trituberculatus]
MPHTVLYFLLQASVQLRFLAQVWSASAGVVEEQQQVWASPSPPKIVMFTSLSSTAGTHASHWPIASHRW